MTEPHDNRALRAGDRVRFTHSPSVIFDERYWPVDGVAVKAGDEGMYLRVSSVTGLHMISVSADGMPLIAACDSNQLERVA